MAAYGEGVYGAGLYGVGQTGVIVTGWIQHPKDKPLPREPEPHHVDVVELPTEEHTVLILEEDEEELLWLL